VVGSNEYANELSFIKGGIFLEELSDYQLFKKGLCSMDCVKPNPNFEISVLSSWLLFETGNLEYNLILGVCCNMYSI
jgi:hypothetical protein